MDSISQPESRFQATLIGLDATSDSIFVHSTNGAIEYFNAAAAVELGFTPEQLRAMPLWGWTPHEPQQVRDAMLAELRDKGTLTYLTRKQLHDGTETVREVRSHWVDRGDGACSVVSVSRDVTESVHAKDILAHLAFHDPLTKVANRTLLEDRLAIAIAAARRHGDLLGVVYIDLDDFKTVNDSYGHCAGDVVLVTLAHRLAESVRHEDTVARVGGDEFVAMLARLHTPQDLSTMARKFAECVREPVDIGELRIGVTASVGYALFDLARDDACSLIARADKAMYSAKHGRNTEVRTEALF